MNTHVRQSPAGAICSGRPQKRQSCEAWFSRNPLKRFIRSSRDFSFGEATKAASEFGADSVCIFLLGFGLALGHEFRDVALGPHDGAYRLGAPLSFRAFARRKRRAGLVEKRSQFRHAGHRPRLLLDFGCWTVPEP